MNHKLYQLLDILDAGRSTRAHYTLQRVQDDQVMITVTLVGRRVEIYVSSNGDVGYSVFSGSEDIATDYDALLKLLKED